MVVNKVNLDVKKKFQHVFKPPLYTSTIHSILKSSVNVQTLWYIETNILYLLTRICLKRRIKSPHTKLYKHFSWLC